MENEDKRIQIENSIREREQKCNFSQRKGDEKCLQRKNEFKKLRSKRLI